MQSRSLYAVSAAFVAFGTAAGGAFVAWRMVDRPAPRLGVIQEGEAFSAYQAPGSYAVGRRDDPYGLNRALSGPYYRRVAVPNGEAASAPPLNPNAWDAAFYERVVSSVATQGLWRRVYRTLDGAQVPYAEFTAMLQEADLPEVYAGIPYADDRYARAYSRANLSEMEAAWNDPTVRASQAAVQLSIMAYVSGFASSRNAVLPAYQQWRLLNPGRPTPLAPGGMIRCETEAEIALNHDCGSPMLADAQHFAYPVIGIHLLAVCYYGTNYPTVPAFAEWAKEAGPDGYCSAFNIPMAADIR